MGIKGMRIRGVRIRGDGNLKGDGKGKWAAKAGMDGMRKMDSIDRGRGRDKCE